MTSKLQVVQIVATYLTRLASGSPLLHAKLGTRQLSVSADIHKQASKQAARWRSPAFLPPIHQPAANNTVLL